MLLTEPKTTVVTGGTSGIGLELVCQLHAAGHRPIAVARSKEKLQRLQEQMPGLAVYCCELSDRKSIERCWETMATEHPDISILINNAGVQFTPRLLDDDFNYDGIEYEVAVNLLAPLWLSYLSIGTFLAHGRDSAIVNISSGLAFYPKVRSAVYCATKAALHSLSQSLRYQLEETPIAVMEVILPLVDTPMTAGRGKAKIPVAEAARRIIAGIAAGKPEVYVGKARLIPALARVAPSLLRAIMKRG